MKAVISLSVGMALWCHAPLAAQGLGLAQLQGGVAIANSSFDGEAAVGGRGAVGFRSGAFVFGPELGYYGLGGNWHLTTAAVFVRVGRRAATGWYGIGSLGYQGPGTSSGGQSLFGAGLGAGWSRRRAGSGLSVEARYLFSLQDVGGPMFGALLLTGGWEWRW